MATVNAAKAMGLTDCDILAGEGKKADMHHDRSASAEHAAA